MRHQHKMWRPQRSPAVGRHSGGPQDIFYGDRRDLSAADLLMPTQEVGGFEVGVRGNQEVEEVGHRRIVTPAASRSQVFTVIPRSRRTNFCTFPVRGEG